MDVMSGMLWLLTGPSRCVYVCRCESGAGDETQAGLGRPEPWKAMLKPQSLLDHLLLGISVST